MYCPFFALCNFIPWKLYENVYSRSYTYFCGNTFTMWVITVLRLLCSLMSYGTNEVFTFMLQMGIIYILRQTVIYSFADANVSGLWLVWIMVSTANQLGICGRLFLQYFLMSLPSITILYWGGKSGVETRGVITWSAIVLSHQLVFLGWIVLSVPPSLLFPVVNGSCQALSFFCWFRNLIT